ncbi:tetratricopeptide repeat protein [Dactylosporangium sp. NPDC049525]|uniref:tetratricopeptide repeat protein n=1 Tax=Dactylosporangium sp. NPDC049525 TaxID=3154730 RepID=UPI00341DD8EC
MSPILSTVDAHRRLRGPFTAAGTLLRQIVPGLLRTHPELVRAHDIEILAAAPELATLLTCERETLTSQASPESRTRYYPYARTVQIGHGLVDLLQAVLADIGPRTLVVTHAEEADRTDAEWLALLARRIDPALLTIVHDAAERGAPASDPARSYVDGDCVSDDPVLLAAYATLDPAERALLHDRRADELLAKGEPSLRLGAICYHREHGSDPSGAGVAALSDALGDCILAGHYDAVLELGRRCLDLADWATQPEACWLATVKMTIALSTMGRADEAMALYDEACARSTSPSVHMQAAYGRAMLYTRYFDEARRDLRKASAWVNTAVSLASLLPEDRRRAYNLTFNENGRALIAMHLGDPAEAMRLIDAGIERMQATFTAGERDLHLSVLRYNRAQLIARSAPEDGVREYTAVIGLDPHHPDYYAERAGLLRRLGRFAEALADYDAAIANGLPDVEPHYNRGDLYAELGDLDAALADFDRVLDLEPDFLAAYVNRAALRYEVGDTAGARADVAAGLDLEPGQPHLLCTRGMLAADSGDLAAAVADYRAALLAEPALAGAWTNLGAAMFELGDATEAVRCFDRALAIEDDPIARANRAAALSVAAVG